VQSGKARVTQVESVVFDIGRVLVRLDFRSILAYFSRHGLDTSGMDDLLEQIELAAYERGEFDGQELLRRIASLGDGRMHVAELHREWLGMFTPDEEMLALARRIASHRRVYLLSNIGDLHWDFLSREIGVDSIGHGALPSFRARAAKPDPAIYRQAEQLFALDPSTTVFIDDLVANVDAARQRGWRAIHHFDYPSTVQDLRSLGVIDWAP
jgi:FMN phosphatase YigB (HAD superfamily)